MILVRILKIIVVIVLVVLAITSTGILVDLLSHLVGIRTDARPPASVVPVLASLLVIGAWLYFALLRINRSLARAENRRRFLMELPELEAELTASTRQLLFLIAALSSLIGLTSIIVGLRASEYKVLVLGVVITVATLATVVTRPRLRGPVLRIDGQRVSRQGQPVVRWEDVVDVKLRWRIVKPWAPVPFPFLVLMCTGKRRVTIPVYGLTMTPKEIHDYAKSRWERARKSRAFE